MLFFYLVADFFSGAFLCNCVPHLVSGLCGNSFPTPFAKPPGQGPSSATTNFLWGTLNLVLGLVLLVRDQFILDLNLPTVAFYAGFILMGVLLARHFQSVQMARRRDI